MWFYGITPVLNGHLSFKAWKFEVEELKEIYGKRVVIQAMKWSLQSPASELVQCLGAKSTYNEIMEELEIPFGEVAQKDALFSELFSTTQGEMKPWLNLKGRLQSICYRIHQTTKDKFDDMDEFLCHNFFRGLHDDNIWEALWPQLEWLHTFRGVLKETWWFEAYFVKRAPLKTLKM